MEIKVLVFVKITASQVTQVLFALQNGVQIPSVILKKHSVSDFAKANSLQRHEEFDFYVNKNLFKYFLLEQENVNSISDLPKELVFGENIILLTWLNFAQAAKNLSNGKEKNILQLAVQYIANGKIDNSVIAADIDPDFIKKGGSE